MSSTLEQGKAESHKPEFDSMEQENKGFKGSHALLGIAAIILVFTVLVAPMLYLLILTDF